jgi:HK97 gp10 family phage protein
MARYNATLELVDADGSFARMTRESRRLLKFEMARAVRATTSALWSDIRLRAPYDPLSGGGENRMHLRDALTWSVSKGGLIGRAGVQNNPREASIGIYNEYGTEKMGAQPFMVPAADANTSRWANWALQAIRDVERMLTIR